MLNFNTSQRKPSVMISDKVHPGKMQIFCRVLGNGLNIPALQIAGILAIAIVFFGVYYNFETVIILHMSLTTIGLVLLTSEAIMIMENKQFCGPLDDNQNALIHGILGSSGLFLTIAGTIIISNNKTMKNERHYDTIHGITGLVSMLFLIVSFIIGIISLVSKHLINGDVLNMSRDTLRWFSLPHHIFGSLGYAIGMGSLCYGTSSTEFRNKIMYEIRLTCVVLTIVVAAWTMVCTFIELCRALKGLVMMYEDHTRYASSQDNTQAEGSGRKINRVFQDSGTMTDGSSNEDER